MKKLILGVLITLLVLLLAVLVTLQALLRPKVLTGLVNKYAAEYVQGDVSFGNIRASVVKSFPFLNLEADDFVITYPHSRYARYDSLYADNRRWSLQQAGRGEEVDTLASFRNLSLSVDYMGIIAGRSIHVRRAELTRARVFGHYYDSTAANWDILPLGGGGEEAAVEESADTSAPKSLPRLIIERVHMGGRPVIIYTNPKDTLFGLFTMKQLTLDGRLDTKHTDRIRTSLDIDSLFVSGRLPADTVALHLERLKARSANRSVDLDAQAKLWLASGSFGRVRLPVGLQLKASYPTPRLVNVDHLGLQLSSLDLQAHGSAVRNETWDIDAELEIDDCPLGELITQFQDNFPVLKKVRTNARVNLIATAKGPYKRPALEALLQVAPSYIDYQGLGRRGRLGLDVEVSTNNLKEVDADIQELFVDFAGARIKATGAVGDILGKDPLISFDGTVRARVDSLTNAFTKDMGISGTGNINAKLMGLVTKSQLNMADIGNADVSCSLTATDLDIDDARDTVKAVIPQLEMELASKANKIDRNLRKGARVLALKVKADTLSAQYGNLNVKGDDVLLLMQNSAQILRRGGDLSALMGILKIGSLSLNDQEGMGVRLGGNTETFRITPATEEFPSPRLSFSTNSQRLGYRDGMKLYLLKDVKFDASATKHQSRRLSQARRDHLLDSLQRVYPGVPRDSLFRRSFKDRLLLAQKDDFADRDIKISLSKGLQSYVREWDFKGNLDLGGGRIMMPSLPLRTAVSGVKGFLTNDTLRLETITIKAGESDISASAKLTGLRRALIGRGKSQMKLKADVSSNRIDANELLRAYAYYSSYQPEENLEKVSDQAIMEAADNAQLPDSAGRKLIVLPSNVDVDFNLSANRIDYDSLHVSWASSDIMMRSRTLQVTNTVAMSNMGDIYFEGFYSTRNKEDLRAGFDLNLVDITAEKVITLFPAVDTLLPMLTSFGGLLDCELAATSRIDTCMNIIVPSVDGIMKISGKNLTLKDSKDFTKIARLLMFKNKNAAHIDNMQVTGMLRDNRLDIFPFVIDIDRYMVAASGVQIMDQWMDYHISVIRSPLLIKFGINARGADFKHMRYSLGRAKYLNANVPVYTTQLQNAQYSLLDAIHNIFEIGVEKAMEENRTANFLAQQQAGSDGTEVSEEALSAVGAFQEGISGTANTRRDALKAEIVKIVGNEQ